MSELPKGWVEATIGEVCNYIQRGKSPKYVESSALPVINQKCVRWAGIDERYLKYVDPEQWVSWTEERFLASDDVLWNSTGTGTIGRAALFKGLQTADRAVVDSHVTILRTNGAVTGAFLHRFIQSPGVQAAIVDMQSGTTNQVELNRAEIIATALPLPPLAEQKRIVAKLDALNAKSARARTELVRIETLVSRYKQAVLSKAFSGDLTREWRGRSDPTTVADIAARIAEERAAMRNSRGLSREGGNRSVPLHAAELGVIPATWIWLNFGQCSYELTVGHVGPMKDRYVTAGIPFLRSLNVKENRIDFRNIAFIDDKFHSELKKSALKPGDLVVIRTGEPGVAAVVPDDLEAANCSDLVICRLVSSIEPHYAAFYMNSSFARSTVGDMQVGVAQQHFNVGAMSKMPVPVPPLEEQHEIVRRIESAFAKIDRLAKEAKRALELVGRLDEAILAKAFRGELVLQDENDEPAEHLLARIRAERAAAPKGKRGRGAKA